MEAADILEALQARAALLPGGRDHEGRPLVVVPVPTDTQPWSLQHLETSLRYFAAIFSPETKGNGLTVVVDAQRGAWRLARACIRQVGASLRRDAASVVVLRPDAFWDKQRVDNCARAQRDGEPVYIPISRVGKHVDWSQLPEDLGGTWCYNHSQWIQNRIYLESFVKDAEVAMFELEKLRQRLTSFKPGMRISSVDETLSFNASMFQGVGDLTRKVLQAGQDLLQRHGGDGGRRPGREPTAPQDVLDSLDRVERLLEIVRGRLQLAEEARLAAERVVAGARELSSLEDGVARVTDWILGPAETMLNGQSEVGFDIVSAEELRLEHEALELQCRETYGHYAELLHKIDTLPQADVPLPEDLKSQRDFMDFVCRSFATRLERRRNVLITSLRFYRLVAEYFEMTSEVFESLVKSNHVETFESASTTLRKLQESQISIGLLELEAVREGEKLADMLCMPVKDALGRDVAVNHESAILEAQALLAAVAARRALFADSVSLRLLTLEQVAHVAQYERDASQAVQWLDDLFKVMLREQGHVGCSVFEIQVQKDEHQAFQETAKGTYEYGCQLLSAALALRRSCKLPAECNTGLAEKLWRSWSRLQAVGQEQMTRLRVSAVFHRSVQEHCAQLRELLDAAQAIDQGEDAASRRGSLHRFLTSRERLLLEVGRMVRLGRLLRTRLREPLCDEHESGDGGQVAVEAISDRLAEVTSLAEQLDAALCGLQRAEAPDHAAPDMRRILDGTASTAPEDWYASGRRPDGARSEDEFVTASECTCTPPSRSSSFHTASLCDSLEADHVSEPEEATPVVRTTTEVRTGVLVHEVTETTRVRLSRGDSSGTTSCTVTTETLRSGPVLEEREVVVVAAAEPEPAEDVDERRTAEEDDHHDDDGGDGGGQDDPVLAKMAEVFSNRAETGEKVKEVSISAIFVVFCFLLFVFLASQFANNVTAWRY